MTRSESSVAVTPRDATIARTSDGTWSRLLVITGLTGFAISQPVLSVLGDNPILFTASDVEGLTLVVFVVAIALVPPLVLWGLVCAVQAVDGRIGRVVYLAIVGLLAALALIQIAKWAGLEQEAALAVLAVVGGAGFAFALSRLEPAAAWARYTAVLPALAIAYFLVASPSGELLRAAPETTRGGRTDMPSVVMLVMDEFPTKSMLTDYGGIDHVRFPHLAAFAEEATWYRHHTALSPFTASAVPSLLTGTVPRIDAPVWTNYPDNLFTLLAPTHELEVFETGTGLCGFDRCRPTAATGTAGLGDLVRQTVQVWRDRIALRGARPRALDDFAEVDVPQRNDLTFADHFNGAITIQVPIRIQSFLEVLDREKGPTFYYLHMMLPHQPWKFYADGRLYNEPDVLGLSLPEGDQPYTHSWNDWAAAVAEQRHLLQAQYTDRLIGRILDAVRDAGLYDDSLVIVTADHGITFESRMDQREPAPRTVDDILYAPLLFKKPGQEDGRVDDSNIMAIDVVPSVAEVLGVEPTWDIDGAPAGSQAILERGASKLWYDIRDIFFPRFEGVVEFEDTRTFPRAADRLIGSLDDPDQPLAALDELLHARRMIGLALDGVARDDILSIEIDRLDDLRRPSESEPPLGVVTGRVEGAPERAEVVLAVDGTVVAGSKLAVDSDGVDGRFTMLLPAGALGPENDIRAAVVIDGVAYEVFVR